MSGNVAATLPKVRTDIIRNRRVLRYALGVTLSVTVFGIHSWEFGSFLCPLLTGMLLSSPVPLTLGAGLGFVLMMVFAMGFFFLYTVVLAPYPVIFLGVLALVLFSIFYAATGNAKPVLILWMVIGVSSIPLLTIVSRHLGWVMAASFMISAAVAVMVTFTVQTLLPDPPTPLNAAPAPRPTPGRSARIRGAAISTITIWPLLALCFTMGWTDYLDVPIYAAVLAISADLQAGLKKGLAIVVANIGGALVSLAMYNLLVALPELWFYSLLMLLVTLLLAPGKFSDAPTAGLYGTALSGILIIMGESTGYSIMAGVKIYLRLFQIIVAATYIVLIFGLLESLWKRKEE